MCCPCFDHRRTRESWLFLPVEAAKAAKTTELLSMVTDTQLTFQTAELWLEAEGSRWGREDTSKTLNATHGTKIRSGKVHARDFMFTPPWDVSSPKYERGKTN